MEVVETFGKYETEQEKEEKKILDEFQRFLDALDKPIYLQHEHTSNR